MGADWDLLADFLSGVDALGSAEALAQATVSVSAPLNLGTVMCGAILPDRDRVEARFHFGNWPSDWQVVYPERVLADDPLVAEARRRIEPFTWSELKAAGGLSAAMQAAFDFTHAHGWLDGFAVPIHGPGGYVALVSFAGGRVDLGSEDRALLGMLARSAHERGRRLSRDTAGEAARLSPRELEVMQWIARGKTDWEAGQILGLSPATVHFHVERVKRRLDARSRAQAIGRLLLAGIL